MQNIIRSIASVLVLGIFIYMAMASFGSTNTTVVPKECGSMPDFTGDIFFAIDFKKADGEGIENAPGELFLVHQVIQDTMTCQSLIVSQQVIPFVTGGHGLYNYSTPTFTHSNSGDLWRIEVNIPPVSGQYFGGRKVDIVKYSGGYRSIQIFEPPQL